MTVLSTVLGTASEQGPRHSSTLLVEGTQTKGQLIFPVKWVFRQAATPAINYVCGFLPEGRDWPFVSPEVDGASETVKMTARCPAVARRLGKVLRISGQVCLFFTCSGQADNDVVATATAAVANELKQRLNGGQPTSLIR